MAFGHELEDLAFTGRQRVQRRVAPASEQLGDHFGVQRGAAMGDSVQGLEELIDPAHPVLEQVADPARPAA